MLDRTVSVIGLGYVGLPLFPNYGDLNTTSSINKILRDVRPDGTHNLGAQSHVRNESPRRKQRGICYLS